MSTSQFRFSFMVGLALIVLGTFIVTKASVGFSLIALGAAIAGLALVTRNSRDTQQEDVAMITPAQPLPRSPGSY